jgi:hypothetical protein
MIPELKMIEVEGIERFVNLYSLSVEQIVKICRDFQADCHDGFVSNDHAYIESKLKEM